MLCGNFARVVNCSMVEYQLSIINIRTQFEDHIVDSYLYINIYFVLKVHISIIISANKLQHNKNHVHNRLINLFTVCLANHLHHP